jgi:hypothetical protein
MALQLRGNPFQKYVTRGATYTADANGVISIASNAATFGDVADLINQGCFDLGQGSGTPYVLEPFASGITAGTTRTQAGATVLTAEINRVDTSTAPAAGSTLGDGVALPLTIGVVGVDITVINNTANPIQVYGAQGDTINGVAAATGIAIPPGDVAKFESAALGDWRVEAGVGSVNALPRLLSASGITAGTTRTQVGATALPADVNRVDTSTAPAVGSLLGDGVILPASASGLDIVIHNNTANPIQVYAQGSDTINGVAGATGIALPPNAVEVFVAAAAGSWIYDAGVGTSGQLATMLSLDAISAAGANQAGATALTADFNRILTATANQGVKLPASAAGLDVFILNHTGVNIIVYGNGSDTIDDIAGATGVTMMTNSVVLFTAYAPGKWYTNGLATGYAGNGLETVQFADSISAAGSSQATATALIAALNNVTTVASGTGVNLPTSSAGLSIVVQNSGINPLQIYPAQGASDTINGIAAATGISILPGTVANFNCTTAGAWVVQPGSTKQSAYNTNAATSATTLTAANITGGVATVDLNMTGALGAGANATLPTVGAMAVALHTPTVGSSFRLRIINSSSGAFSWTVVTNTGWTLNGTMTIAQNTWREFVVTLTSLTAATLQSVATGTYS